MKNPFDKYDQKYVKLGVCLFLTTLAAIISLYLLYCLIPWFGMVWDLIAAVMRPLLFGMVLAYLLLPAVHFFEKRFQKKHPGKKWTRSVSVLVVLLLIFLGIGILLAMLVLTASKQVTEIDYDSMTNYLEEIENSLGVFSTEVKDFLAEQNFSTSTVSNQVAANVTGFLHGAVTASSTIFFGIIFAVYFLIDVDNISAYWKRAVKTLLSEKTILVVKELAQDADKCFSGYIRGQALDALLVGVVTSILMQLIGMPYAPLIGLITGIGNLIPYVGPILGYGSVVLINIIKFNPVMLIIGLVVIAIIMFVDGNFINPRLLAGTVHVHPLLVIAALLAGGAIGGVLGMLLAVPVGAFAKIQFDKLIDHREKK